MEPLDRTDLVPLAGWRPEPLFANGTRIYTMDMGLMLARVPYGPGNGLTEAEARHWAALLAAAPAALTFCENILRDSLWSSDALEIAARHFIATCEPKAKGHPFRQLPIAAIGHEVVP